MVRRFVVGIILVVFSGCAVGGVAKRVVIDCILLELVQV